MFVRYTIILGSFFSFSYCIKMIFMFSGEIIKFKYVDYSFNIYVVYNIVVYIILIFLNYIAYYFGYIYLINFNFIFSILTVLSLSSIFVYLDFKKIIILTNFYLINKKLKGFFKSIFTFFCIKYKNKIRFLLYKILLIILILYSLFKFLIKKDYSFETTHTLLFYLVIIIIFFILVESYIRKKKTTLKFIYLILLFFICLFFYYQVDYIWAKMSVTFPDLTRFLDVLYNSGCEASNDITPIEEGSNLSKFLSKLFKFIGELVEYIESIIKGK